jgi:hypothetical protein
LALLFSSAYVMVIHGFVFLASITEVTASVFAPNFPR